MGEVRGRGAGAMRESSSSETRLSSEDEEMMLSSVSFETSAGVRLL